MQGISPVSMASANPKQTPHFSSALALPARRLAPQVMKPLARNAGPSLLKVGSTLARGVYNIAKGAVSVVTAPRTMFLNMLHNGEQRYLGAVTDVRKWVRGV